MTRMRVCHTIDKEILKTIEEEAKKIGVSRSKMIEIKLREVFKSPETRVSIKVR